MEEGTGNCFVKIKFRHRKAKIAKNELKFPTFKIRSFTTNILSIFWNCHVPPVHSKLPQYRKRGPITIATSENRNENIAKQLALMWQNHFYCPKHTSLFIVDS
jgi:hypothetical protein